MRYMFLAQASEAIMDADSPTEARKRYAEFLKQAETAKERSAIRWYAEMIYMWSAALRTS